MAAAETEMLGRGSALAQLFALLYDIAFTFCSSIVRSLLLASRFLFQRTTNTRLSEGGAKRTGEVEFYEGNVSHERRKPAVHRFEYNVRYAFVNLDKPPSWFDASHHMTAYEARSIAATDGPVYISQGGVAQCIAEDMKAVWQMQAATPGQELLLRIGVQHPDYGNYFQAILKAKRVDREVDPEAFTWIMPHKVAF